MNLKSKIIIFIFFIGYNICFGSAFLKKINPKMINVVAVGRSWPDRKYPTDLLVVNDPKITLYMLKNTK